MTAKDCPPPNKLMSITNVIKNPDGSVYTYDSTECVKPGTGGTSGVKSQSRIFFTHNTIPEQIALLAAYFKNPFALDAKTTLALLSNLWLLILLIPLLWFLYRYFTR